MTNSRCVVVLALPRSGSSCVAGALHRLGVDLGEGFLQPADESNARGYFEDMRWGSVNKALAGRYYTINEPSWLPDRARKSYMSVLRTCLNKPIWGMKSPRLCQVLHLILPMLEGVCDVRLVHVCRDWDTNVASLQQHSETAYRGRLRMTRDEAEALLLKWQAALERQLAGFGGPILEVSYDDLIDGPVSELKKLESFCFEGIMKLSAGVEDAEAWLSPLLRHHVNEDGDENEDPDSDDEPEAGGEDGAAGDGDGGDPELGS